MLRHLAIAAVALTPALGVVPDGRVPPLELMPGVTFQRTLQPTLNGPVALDVLIGPRPGTAGPTTLEPILTSGTLTRRATLSSAEARLSADGTYAGVNADFFNFTTGLPSGGFVTDAGIVAPPSSGRSTAGVLADGTLDVRRVGFSATWTGTGASHELNGVNKLQNGHGTTLFTPAWGEATPAFKGAVAAVLFPLPPVSPGVDLSATVQQIVPAGSPVSIPLGGGVLVARGSAVAQLTAEAPVGTPLNLELVLLPTWPSVVWAVGGGPQIVRAGAPVFRADEDFTSSQLGPRAARTAVGQRKDGRVILLVVDGRQPEWSVGMTNFELGQALVRLGAVTGMALDSGGSSTMAFDGTVLNRPSDGVERRITSALAFVYRGVLARATQVVVSPNGDGADDAQSLSLKVVRPSTVTVRLTSPDGTAAFQDSGARLPGTYAVPFPPAGGGAPAEGTWQLAVAATDEQGGKSSSTKSFSVDNTLGYLQTSPRRLFLPPGGRELTISWRQTRAARVVVTIETKAGSLVRTVAAGPYAAGDASVAWNGLDRNGQRVKGGVYVVHVVAKSAIGTAQLARTLPVRQIAG